LHAHPDRGRSNRIDRYDRSRVRSTCLGTREHCDSEQRHARQPHGLRQQGSLATIGRKSAVADFGLVKFWGAPAWWLWGLVHVGFLVGVRNRVSTMTNCFWSYLTFSGGIRLITGAPGPQPGESVPVS